MRWPWTKKTLPPSAEEAARVRQTLEGTVNKLGEVAQRTSNLESVASSLGETSRDTLKKLDGLTAEVQGLKDVPFDPKPYDAMDAKLAGIK